MLLEAEALLVEARGSSCVSRTRSSAASRGLAWLVAPMAWPRGVRGEGIAWLVAPMAWPRGVRGEGIGATSSVAPLTVGELAPTAT